MEDPGSSAAPPRRHPARGRAHAPGAIYWEPRAQVHDGVTFMHVSTGWDHERFREYVIGHAKRAQVAEDQASLAKATEIDTGSLGRYFRGQVQPSEVNLERIQRAIPGTTMKDLRILAGRAKPEEYEMSGAPAMPTTAHPTAQRVDRLLGPKSPLAKEQRAEFELFVNRLADSYEKLARRRSA